MVSGKEALADKEVRVVWDDYWVVDAVKYCKCELLRGMMRKARTIAITVR